MRGRMGAIALALAAALAGPAGCGPRPAAEDPGELAEAYYAGRPGAILAECERAADRLRAAGHDARGVEVRAGAVEALRRLGVEPRSSVPLETYLRAYEAARRLGLGHDDAVARVVAETRG